jgi:uncharacterized protein with PIN domain
MITVRDLLASRVSAPTLKTAASSTEAPISSTAKFQEIHSFMSENKCPRCKKAMESVKLANYEKANYCPGCKVALWAD